MFSCVNLHFFPLFLHRSPIYHSTPYSPLHLSPSFSLSHHSTFPLLHCPFSPFIILLHSFSIFLLHSCPHPYYTSAAYTHSLHLRTLSHHHSPTPLFRHHSRSLHFALLHFFFTGVACPSLLPVTPSSLLPLSCVSMFYA